jgi:hypothetical protein
MLFCDFARFIQGSIFIEAGIGGPDWTRGASVATITPDSDRPLRARKAKRPGEPGRSMRLRSIGGAYDPFGLISV